MLKRGFKQGGGGGGGGVLSPLLFVVYIDEMFLQLHGSGFSSYIGHFFFGVLAYADDVTLLGPTLTSVYKINAQCC